MPIQYDIKKRLYKELTKEKDFIAFLKNAGIALSAICGSKNLTFPRSFNSPKVIVSAFSLGL